MAKAVFFSRSGPSIGWRRKRSKARCSKVLRCGPAGVDRLKFVACLEDKLGAGLGTDADPVDAGWGGLGSIRLDAQRSPRRMARR